MKPQNISRLVTTWNHMRQILGWFWLVACLTGAWLSWHPSVPAPVAQQVDSTALRQWNYVPQTALFSNEAEVSESLPSEIHFISTDSLVSESRKLRTKPIEQIKIGERVAAFNPELSKEEHQVPEPDWSNYKQVTLVAYQDGVRYDVELLRPITWIDETNAKVGGSINLVVEEMGLTSKASVEAIHSSPVIKKGSGRVVTGTFKHPAGNIRNLYVEGLSEPIGVTEYHPFWVESRLAFAQVKDLKLGERLLSSKGTTYAIQRIEERRSTEMVFNLEVEQEHCFQVSNAGIVTHNDCFDVTLKPGKSWKKGKKISDGDAIDIVKGGGSVYAPGGRNHAGTIASGAGNGGPIWHGPHKGSQVGRPHAHPSIDGEKGAGHVFY